MAGREFDIVLLGATGYTGRLTAETLVRNCAREPVRLAIAGRSRAKLEAVRRDLAAGSPAPVEVAIVEADVGDPASLRAMAGRAQVCIDTVGPYVLHGEPVVGACIDARTDYVDLTGEPEFVDGLLTRHDAAARAAGVRIVNSCGFDSVPHDLGVLFTLDRLAARTPRDRRGRLPVTIDGFVRVHGGFSGGTWASLVLAFARRREAAAAHAAAVGARSPIPGRSVRCGPGRASWRPDFRAWALPMPTIDPAVIARSARASPDYGPDFRYAHHLLVRRLSGVAATASFLGGAFLLAQVPPVRDLLLRLRPSGAGPTPAQRERGRFRIVFLGTAGGRSVRCEVAGGDPGYGETAKMLAQSGLCLAHDRVLLPEAAGVITPAQAMGRRLIERLRAAGISFTEVAGQGG